MTMSENIGTVDRALRIAVGLERIGELLEEAEHIGPRGLDVFEWRGCAQPGSALRVRR